MENIQSTLGPQPTPVERPAPPVSRGAAVVLAVLASQEEPVGLTRLEQTTSLHANTLREHLGNLVRDGLVSRVRADPHGRGRPAWMYAARTDGRAAHSEYAGLATALAAALSTRSATPSDDAAAAGEAWGHELARAEPAAVGIPASKRVTALLDGLGFTPRAGKGSQLRLTTCPLLDAARRYPDVVCAVHLGIVRGALAGFGAAPDGTRLVPFAEPGACLVHFPASTTRAS